MEGKLLASAIVLLLLGLSGLLVVASDLPAYDYIDWTLSNLEEDSEFYKRFTDLVEERGSEKPE